MRTLMLWIPDSVCFGVVGLITASTTKSHRRVGDMAAGTYVVKKTSVGYPVVSAVSSPVYFGTLQPQWAPPPAGGGYGMPMPTAQPQWAPPPATTGAPPQSWGVQPQPDSTEVPSSFGNSPADATSAAPGWGAPEMAPPATTDLPQAQPVAPTVDPTQPQWDAARHAYIAWEPTRQLWMQHDTTTNEWRPI